METIHLKTVDPISQNILRTAAQKGINLNWERYEKLQPQDGFLRLGLSCPFGCMQGPCRIDPFGEGATKGVCGADADVIAARNLVRHIAAGSSCHNDHGREFVHTLKLVAEGKNNYYQIKSPEKLTNQIEPNRARPERRS